MTVQRSTSFVNPLCFFCLVFALPLLRVCLYVPYGHLLCSRLWCLTVSLSLSHWYPGLGVVLDCIDSRSLHPYLIILNCCICFCTTWFLVSAMMLAYLYPPLHTGPRCAVGNVSGYRCVSDCRSRGREFDPGPVPYFRGD